MEVTLATERPEDASPPTHRARISISAFSILRQRHHIRHYLDGTLVAALAIQDAADTRVLFTHQVSVKASERERKSSRDQVTSLLVQDASTKWLEAVRAKGGAGLFAK